MDQSASSSCRRFGQLTCSSANQRPGSCRRYKRSHPLWTNHNLPSEAAEPLSTNQRPGLAEGVEQLTLPQPIRQEQKGELRAGARLGKKSPQSQETGEDARGVIKSKRYGELPRLWEPRGGVTTERSVGGWVGCGRVRELDSDSGCGVRVGGCGGRLSVRGWMPVSLILAFFPFNLSASNVFFSRAFNVYEKLAR